MILSRGNEFTFMTDRSCNQDISMSTFHVFVLNNKLAIDAVVVWGECPFNWKSSQPGYCVFFKCVCFTSVK